MKKIWIINAVIMAVCFVANYFYTSTSELSPKIIASGAFAFMGIINYAYMHKKGKTGKFHFVLLLGLLLAAAGDIALDITFIIGAALFASGHLFFFGAQNFLYPFKAKDLIPTAVLGISTAGFLWFSPVLNYPSDFMKIVAVVYAVIISFMAGKSIADLIRKPQKTSIILALGCCLFMFSDLMLALDWFMNSLLANDLCMATYYPAECILALSILLIKKEG